MLGENAWQNQYEMTLALHDAATELASLCGDFEAMEHSAKTVIAKAKNAIDKANVYQIKINANTASNKYIEAIALSQKILAELGIIFPKTPTQEDIQHSLIEIETLIKNRRIEELANLPRMKDREKSAILQIAHNLISPCNATASNLFFLVVALLVKMSIQYGNSEASCFAYNLYGYLCCTIKQDIETGVQFADLALQLLSLLNAKRIKPQVSNITGGFIWHHKHPLKQTLSLIKEGYLCGLEIGEYDYTGHCAVVYCINSLWCGQPLKNLEQEIRAYCHQLRQIKQLKSGNQCQMFWQIILNLLGASDNPTILSGEALSEVDSLSLDNPDLSWFGLFYVNKVMLCYWFGDIVSARKNVLKAWNYSMPINGTFLMGALPFYDALSLLAAIDLGLEEMSAGLQQVEEKQIKLKYSAKYAPMNYQHKVDLVEAEKYRVLGQKGKAIEFYHQAIAGAKANEYIQEEALAYELLAKLYLDWGQEKVAQVYMTEAHHCYSLWGAVAKVKHLEENYPQLYPSEPKTTTVQVGTKVTSDSTENTTLDLATVIKATNAIASEIVLDKLLATLMKIIIENAGADRGILLLPRGESLWVEAIKEANSDNISVLASIPLEEFAQISVKTVNYVARTLETVVLNDARHENAFADDAYIQKYCCQSIACTPFVTQGKLQGIVYLENNLTPETFTEERMALLRTIATQAAISLENARLYETLEQRVRERTAELSHTVEVLKKTQAELKLENDLLKTDEQAASFDYQIGGSLDVDSPTYVVRSADRHLYQAIRLGEFCYTFNARQMGKSSLMVRILKKLNQEGYRCIAIDLTLIGGENVTPDQWYKGLAVELWRRFNLLGKVNLKSWWAERLDIPAPQRLMQFIEDVLLVEVKTLPTQEPANLAIFLDEIDCILSLNFPVNDFFALIRSCYNQRPLDSKYKRLTFGFFGVATPSMLMSDPLKTPFNLGRPIQLAGFKVNEAQPLLYGLGEKVHNPQTLLKEIISWTGGQPFLTQKLCKLIRNEPSEIPTNGESQWLAELVQEKIIQHWETQDEPEHLRTIRDRLRRSSNKIALLRLYEDILTDEEVSATDSETEQELLLSGLVISTAGRLQINNRIYQAIFDRHWLEEQSE